MAKYRARRLPDHSCTPVNKIAGGAAAKIGNAALSQIPHEKAKTFAAALPQRQ